MMVHESRRAAPRLPRAWRPRAPWRRTAATLGGLGLLLLRFTGPLAPVDVAAESLVGARVSALAVSPQDGTLWIATARGLFRSPDEGRTAQAVPLPGSTPAPEVTGVAVDPKTGRTVYVATGGAGIFRSEDGGATWVTASTGLAALDVRGLAVSPTDGRLHAQVRGKGLFRSQNGAQPWQRVDNGPAGMLHALASVNISTGMGGIFLYAATDQGLVRGPD